MKRGFQLPKLSRDPVRRKRMLRQLVTYLFEHEGIRTTLARATLVRRYAERAISMAKRGSEKGRIKVFEFVNRPAIGAKVLTEIAPRYKDRAGGYTRIWKLGPSKDDYQNPMAYIELVDGKKELRKQFIRLAETLKAKKEETTAGQSQ